MDGKTVAMVSLTTGNPDDPDSAVTAATWLIGDSTSGEAFTIAMTERYGKPVLSMQPGDYLGTDEGLIILHEDAAGFLAEPGADDAEAGKA